MDDMNVLGFADFLQRRKRHYPISDEYIRIDGHKGAYWTDQREHMVSWFRAQATLGSGAYTRETVNWSAKRAYNRLQCSEALLWIAEAIGVDSESVQAAADEAAKAGHHSKRCGVIRSMIPWDTIWEGVQTCERRPSAARVRRKRSGGRG